MSLQPDLRRLAVAATLVCMTVMSIGEPATATPSSSTVTVSGQSVEQVIFSVRDPADDVTAFVDEGGLSAAGICYALGGEITVSSNVAYDLLASDVAATPGLHFMTESPASYAACADGEPVSDTVFATTDLPGRWAVRQPRTRARVHAFTLGLVVGSGDDPLAILAGSSFTVSAQAAN